MISALLSVLAQSERWIRLGRILSQLPDAACVPLPTVTYLSVGSEGFRYEFLSGMQRIFPPDATVAHNLASTEGGRMLHHEVRLGDAPVSGSLPLIAPAPAVFAKASGHKFNHGHVLVAGGPAGGSREVISDREPAGACGASRGFRVAQRPRWRVARP